MLRHVSACAVLCSFAAAQGPSRPAPDPVARAERGGWFLEDAPARRPVATMQAVVARHDDDARLELTVSAMGAGIDPLPGIEGRPDANVRTAEELERLLQAGEVRLITRHRGQELAGGAPPHVRRERVPQARLHRDGRFEPDATTGSALPVSVTFHSAALPEGRSWSYLLAEGVPRIAVQVEIGGRLAVLALESLGAQDPGLLPADFAQRDLEGKWVAYRRAVERGKQDAKVNDAICVELGARGEVELLEWIALYEGWRHAGPVLNRLDDPRVLRVALWNLDALDSHSRDTAFKALTGRGGVALRWLQDHRVPAVGKAKKAYDALQGSALVEPGRHLPPFDPMQLLVPRLDAPRQLADFGDRLTAEPRVHYAHQVVRALDGVLVWGNVDEMTVSKVLALSAHEHEQVRTRAYLTLSRLPAGRVPFVALLRQADDAGLDARWRQLALLAATQSNHPEVYYALLRIAGDGGHAMSAVATRRAGELGDAETAVELRRLETLVEQGSERHTALMRAIAAIDSRMATRQFVHTVPMRRLLERVAWLQHRNDPRAAKSRDDALALLAQQLEGAQRNAILDGFLQAPFEVGTFAGAEAATIEKLVLEYVQTLR